MDVDYKTVVEAYQALKSATAKLENVEEKYTSALQGIQNSIESVRLGIVGEVRKEVAENTLAIKYMIDAFKNERMSIDMDQERRILFLEQNDGTQEQRLASVESNTKPIPGLVQDVDNLKNRPGGVALKAWQKVLAAAGALMLLVVGALVNRIF